MIEITLKIPEWFVILISICVAFIAIAGLVSSWFEYNIIKLKRCMNKQRGQEDE